MDCYLFMNLYESLLAKLDLHFPVLPSSPTRVSNNRSKVPSASYHYGRSEFS